MSYSEHIGVDYCMLEANSGLKGLFLGCKNGVNPRGSMSKTELGCVHFGAVPILRTIDFVEVVVFAIGTKSILKIIADKFGS